MAPKSALGAWERDIELFNAMDQEILRSSITLINYDKVWRGGDKSPYNKKYGCIILDEAHLIKNRSSQRSKFLLKLACKADYRYILTGTPIGNGQLENIWSLYCFLDPYLERGRVYSRIFGGSYQVFQDRYCILNMYHKPSSYIHVNGVSPEDTIRGETDIFKFQNIVKTGGTYEGSYHYIDGELTPLQKVNRIYAVKDPKYGKIVKRKYVTEERRKDKATGKMVSIPVTPYWKEDTVSECPDHAFTDNENVLTVGDLDLDYYIEMAKGRIDKYINLDRKVENKLKKIKEVISIMATKTETKTTEEIRSSNIYAKLIEARKQFLAAGIKKTGVNRYAEFKYFTLDDIIPVKQSIFEGLGLADVISFGTEVATLTLFNADNPDETIEFMSPLREDESLIKNPIQKLGAVETYVRRYLYMLMLDIVEADAVEAVTDKPDPETGKAAEGTAKKSNRPATEAERQEAKKDLIDKGGEATDEEIACIRWHMGAYETDTKMWNYYGRAIETFPNVLYTHTADMIASKIRGV